MEFFTHEWEVPSGRPNRRLVLQAAEEFTLNGALGIRGAFSKEMIQELQMAFALKSGMTENEWLADCQETGHKRYMSAFKIEPPFSDPELYANRSVLSVIKTLLGKNCKLDTISAVTSYPGSEMQHIHRDHDSLFMSEEICVQLPPYAISVVIPLVDVDMETGPTAVWDGSHRMVDALDFIERLKKQPDLSGASFPITTTGDCYLMDYRLVHSGLPNLSTQERTILVLVYSCRWFHDVIEYDGLPSILIEKSQYEAIPKKHRGLFCGIAPYL